MGQHINLVFEQINLVKCQQKSITIMLYKTIIYKNLRSWWIPKPPLSVPVGLKKHWDSTMSQEKKLPTNIKSFLFLCYPIDDFQIISNSPECLTYCSPKSDKQFLQHVSTRSTIFHPSKTNVSLIYKCYTLKP